MNQRKLPSRQPTSIHMMKGKDRADGSPPLSVRKCMKEVAVQKNEKVM